MSVRDLIIIGAGPSGLSAAIAAKQHRLDYQVVEQGVLVNSIFNFRRRWCSSRRPSCSRSAGCRSSRRSRSRPAPRRCSTTARSSTRSTCRSRSRRRCCPSSASCSRGDRPASVGGVRRRDALGARSPPRPARAGTSSSRSATTITANLLNVPGEDLPHVHHYYGEPHPYYRQRVVIVGGGNSAAECGARAVPLRRAMSRWFTACRAEVDDQVLGQAGYRKPDQGRLGGGPLQHLRHRNSSDVGDHQDPPGSSGTRSCRPTPSSC